MEAIQHSEKSNELLLAVSGPFGHRVTFESPSNALVSSLVLQDSRVERPYIASVQPSVANAGTGDLK